jgi:hypothetical protein
VLELNLGGNEFEGQILSLLGKLQNLPVDFNLGNNSLNGEIPTAPKMMRAIDDIRNKGRMKGRF